MELMNAVQFVFIGDEAIMSRFAHSGLRALAHDGFK